MWIEFRTIGHKKRAFKEGSEQPQKLIKKIRVSGELSKIIKGEFRARDKVGEPRSERAIQLTAQRRHRGPGLCQGGAGEGWKEVETHEEEDTEDVDEKETEELVNEANNVVVKLVK